MGIIITIGQILYRNMLFEYEFKKPPTTTQEPAETGVIVLGSDMTRIFIYSCHGIGTRQEWKSTPVSHPLVPTQLMTCRKHWGRWAQSPFSNATYESTAYSLSCLSSSSASDPETHGNQSQIRSLSLFCSIPNSKEKVNCMHIYPLRADWGSRWEYRAAWGHRRERTPHS